VLLELLSQLKTNLFYFQDFQEHNSEINMVYYKTNLQTF